MSNVRNDRVPEDHEVLRAYRALPEESIPAELDRRVIEEARAAIGQRPERQWVRWSGPLAAAASVLVVIAIVFDPTAREAAQVAAPAQAPVPIVARDQAELADSLRARQARQALAKQARESDASAREAASASRTEAREREPAARAEEIRVTARRREENLQSVPVAVTALSEDTKPEAPVATAPTPQSARDASKASSTPSAPPPPAAQTSDQTTRLTSSYRREREAEEGSNDSAVAQAIANADTVTPVLKTRLGEILKLRREGQPAAAERAIAKLREEYPALNVEAELKALEAEEAKPAP